MNFAPKEVKEIEVKRFDDCPLAKLAEGKIFDKPMSEYFKPFYMNDDSNPKRYLEAGKANENVDENLEKDETNTIDETKENGNIKKQEDSIKETKGNEDDNEGTSESDLPEKKAAVMVILKRTWKNGKKQENSMKSTIYLLSHVQI